MIRRPPSRALVLGALAVAQAIYGRRPARSPASTRAMLLAILATSTFEGTQARGARCGALPAAVAGGSGFVAELMGVRTGVPFGRYAYSGRLGPRIGGVPLLAAGAWAAMARPAWVTAGWVTEAPLPRVMTAAGALTAWDVFLDPRLAREGYWRWERPGRYEGIPASNFLGWWLTASAAFALVARLDPFGSGTEDDAALALYVWTWVGETFANGVLWRQQRAAVAGGVAMGLFATPALARRRVGQRR